MFIFLLLGLATFALLFLLTIGIDRMERWDRKD
jgi:hypothetical protein